MAHFDIITYYAKWEDPVYKNYINLVSQNSELEKLVLNTPYEANINGSIYSITNPTYVNIDTKLKELKKELNDVQIKHMSVSFDTHQKSILDFIHALQYYKALVLNTQVKRQPHHNEDLFNTIVESRADTSQLVKRYIEDHITYLNKNMRGNNEFKSMVYIESLPIVELKGKELKPKKVAEPKPKNVKEKAVKEGVEPKQKKVISKVVKSPLQRLLEDSPFGKFAFNQREDCRSKERKQKFYMSKENILKAIDSLKKEDREKLPKALKSLTKEKICDLLFDIKKN